MSGGHFNYEQFKIKTIADSIQSLIDSNDDQRLNEWGSPRGRGYSPETIEVFRSARRELLLGYVLAHRIDWLVSDDDSEETFHRRLKADMVSMGLLEEDGDG